MFLSGAHFSDHFIFNIPEINYDASYLIVCWFYSFFISSIFYIIPIFYFIPFFHSCLVSWAYFVIFFYSYIFYRITSFINYCTLLFHEEKKLARNRLCKYIISWINDFMQILKYLNPYLLYVQVVIFVCVGIQSNFISCHKIVFPFS